MHVLGMYQLFTGRSFQSEKKKLENTALGFGKEKNLPGLSLWLVPSKQKKTKCTVLVPGSCYKERGSEENTAVLKYKRALPPNCRDTSTYTASSGLNGREHVMSRY